MNNSFEIRGETAVIFVRHRRAGSFEVIVDAADLPGIRASYGNVFVSKSRGGWYAKTRYCTGETMTERAFVLSRMLLDAPAGLLVDHRNHNTLDNRRENIRIVDHTGNQLNRFGANRDNKSSGIRGVHWDANARKWKARIKKNGVSHHLGMFVSKGLAALAVQTKLAELEGVAHAS